MVSHFAGNGFEGNVDGPAGSYQYPAIFNGPGHLAFDSQGALYLEDTNPRSLRKIDTAGHVTTLSVGPLVVAFNSYDGLCVTPQGTIWIADMDAGGLREFVPGQTAWSYVPTHPVSLGQAVCAPDGTVYYTDGTHHTVLHRELSGHIATIAGTGTAGFADGAGTAAAFDRPQGLALDAAGNLYVGDTNNHRVRKIDPDHHVTTLAGTDSTAAVDGPTGVGSFEGLSGPMAADALGNVFVTDGHYDPMTSSWIAVLRQIDPAGNVTTVAGQGPRGNFGAATIDTDGPGALATFGSISGLAVNPQGDLLIADRVNRRLRKLDAAGNVSTYSGITRPAVQNGFTPVYIDGTAAADGNAQFDLPSALATDGQGNTYVLDVGDNRVRKIDAAGQVTTLAGSGFGYSSVDGPGATASFNRPTGLAADPQGNVYVAEFRSVRKIDPGGNVTTLSAAVSPLAICVDASGRLFVFDQDFGIKQLDASGQITIRVRSNYETQDVDGPSGVAAFTYPSGLAADTQGNLFVIEQYSKVRRIDPSGNVTTVAKPQASPARQPVLAVSPTGRLFAADAYFSQLYEIDASGVTTLAGNSSTLYVDGPGGDPSVAGVYQPGGLAFDSQGRLLFADTGHHCIRQITW